MPRTSTYDGPRLASSRSLTRDEIALIELYQRQDALSTQFWQQFLLANATIVLIIAIIVISFPESARFAGVSLNWILSVPVLGVWAVFTYGGLSAIQNSQKILLSLAHQIEGDVGDKTDLFINVTRSVHGVKWFHIGVDVFVFALCVALLVRADYTRFEAPAPAPAPAPAVQGSVGAEK